MNKSGWETSRKAYVVYRKTKRTFRKLLKTHNRTYRGLEKGFEDYMAAQSEALNNLDDPTQPDKLRKALKDFQKSKSDHDASRDALSEQFKVFQSSELEYSVMIFKVLRGVYGMKLQDLSSAFGIWHSRISDWIRAETKTDLVSAYEKEFGTLEDDPDLDENS